ncbi:MAG TPA: hypothetical protein VI306_09290 [Pyrinomonadaceae bacterium]
MTQEMLTMRHESFYQSFRSARDEELFRIRRRDHWLKLQLFAQGAIWALSKGMNLEMLKPGVNPNDGLSVAALIACILTLLFYVEDSLVRHISCFIQKLCEEADDPNLLTVFDNSPQIKDYLRDTLKWRFVGQLFTFFVLPMLLTIDRFRSRGWSGFAQTEITLDAVLYVIIVWLLFGNYLKRRYSVPLGEPSNSLRKRRDSYLLYFKLESEIATQHKGHPERGR